MNLINFETSFADKNGINIKVGDTIKIQLESEREQYHYEDRFDMMGNSKPIKVLTGVTKFKGWAIYKIKWSGSCVIADHVSDSGNVECTSFYYLNEVFKGEDFEIINN